MTGKTRCPDCATVFFVSDTQLTAREGFVRCGRCGALFNATLHFVEEPSPSIDEGAILPETVVESLAPETAAGTPSYAEFVPDDTANRPEGPHPAATESTVPPPPPPEPPAQGIVPKKRRSLAWLWSAAVLVLSIGLMVQMLWWFRGDIAARFPPTRAVLDPACKALGCDIPLPRDPDRLKLASTELESDPAKLSQITLRALLTNHAPFIQAFPHMELTLTDTAERVLARRVFAPADYLPPGTDPGRGIAAGLEVEVKMRLSLDGFTASGYQLELFFP